MWRRGAVLRHNPFDPLGNPRLGGRALSSIRDGSPPQPWPWAETALGALDGGRRSGVPLSLPVQKTQALFAYAALKPDQLHARAKIMTLRWGDQEERLAGQNLRRALYLIRSVAGTNGVRRGRGRGGAGGWGAT